VRALYTDSLEDVNKMVDDGYRFAARRRYDDDFRVVRRHRTYKAALNASSDTLTIVDLLDILDAEHGDVWAI